MSTLRNSVSTIGDFIRELLPNAYVWNASQSPFSSPNEYAVGILIQPGPHTLAQKVLLGTTYPMGAANWWGHTAIYVREKGRIVRAVGYDPDRLRMFTIGLVTGETFAVARGTSGTHGVIYDENTMLRSPDVICVEFAVAERFTRDVLRHMPKEGLPERGMQRYVTRGGSRMPAGTFDANRMGNCIDFVQRILRKAGLELHTVGAPFGSAQGRLPQAALGDQLQLRRIKDRSVYPPLRIQTDAVRQLSRRVGGAMRSLGFATKSLSLLAQLEATFGVTNLVALLEGVLCGVLDGLLAYLGLPFKTADFFVGQTLLFVVFMLDFFLETARYKKLKWGASMLSTVLTAGAVFAWVGVLTGNGESANQLIMSYLTLVNVAIA
jgi:hypothetical protein